MRKKENKKEVKLNREDLDKKVDEEKIMNILKEDPLTFLLNVIKKIHIGDVPILLLLILSGLSSGFRNRKLVFHVKTVGSFSKGKSTAQESVSLVFNLTDRITSSSAKAKFYKADAGKLNNGGIIIFEEAEGSQEAIVIERALTDDKLSDPKHETVNDSKEYKEMSIPQVNAVWKNCASLDLDDQLNSRFLLVNVDETTYQDNAVYDKDINQYSTFNFVKKDSEEILLARQVTDKIKEEPIKILIPYGKLIKCNDKSNRRSLTKFMRLIYSIVYANRFRRPVINGYVISILEDFELAQLIWDNSVQKLEVTKLDEKHNEVLANLNADENNPKGRKELSDELNLGNSTILKRLKTLIQMGLVNYKEDRTETKKKLYWKVRECQGVFYTIDNVTSDDIIHFFTKSVGLTKESVPENLVSNVINAHISETLRQSIQNNNKNNNLSNIKDEKESVKEQKTMSDNPKQSQLIFDNEKPDVEVIKIK